MATPDNYTFGFLEQRGDALFVRVRAAPGARRDRVVGIYSGVRDGILRTALKVSVSAAPEKGKANRAICRVLARALELRPSQVSLHSGTTSRDKKVRVDGLSRAAAEERLRAAGIGSADAGEGIEEGPETT